MLANEAIGHAAGIGHLAVMGGAEHAEQAHEPLRRAHIERDAWDGGGEIGHLRTSWGWRAARRLR